MEAGIGLSTREPGKKELIKQTSKTGNEWLAEWNASFII